LLRFVSNKVAFHLETKMGTSKMDRRDQELLDKQMRRLTPPRHEGAIAVMLAAMFLIGMTVGSLLSVHQSEPIQIATMGTRG
jgi:hypothetical protein